MKAKSLFCALLCSLLLAGVAHAESVNFQVMLVDATNGGGGKDPKLARIERALRAAIGGRYNTFKYAGGGSSSVNVPGNTSVGLGGGYTADIDAKSVSGNRVTAKVTWKKGKTILDTTFSASKGAPTVYARPQGKAAKLLVVIPR